MADAQFAWSKSMDTSSAPYSEQIYPYDPSLNYGRSDYNVGKAFKLFGMWQPVFFHGSNSWMEKIAGGWSLSGIFNYSLRIPLEPGGEFMVEASIAELAVIHNCSQRPTWAALAAAPATINSRPVRTILSVARHIFRRQPTPPTAAPTSDPRFRRPVSVATRLLAPDTGTWI